MCNNFKETSLKFRTMTSTDSEKKTFVGIIESKASIKGDLKKTQHNKTKGVICVPKLSQNVNIIYSVFSFRK